MKHFVIVLSSFLILFCCSSTAQKLHSTSFEEITVRNSNKPITNILIIGVGLTASRIFLEKLGDRLVDKFKDHKVRVEYKYLGSDTVSVSKFFDSSNLKDFEAILVFIPKDTAFFSTILSNPSAKARKSNPHYSPTSYSIGYSQNFYLQLFNYLNYRDPFWTAVLDVNCDIRSENVYSFISKQIYKRFKANKYI